MMSLTSSALDNILYGMLHAGGSEHYFKLLRAMDSGNWDTIINI